MRTIVILAIVGCLTGAEQAHAADAPEKATSAVEIIAVSWS